MMGELPKKKGTRGSAVRRTDGRVRLNIYFFQTLSKAAIAAAAAMLLLALPVLGADLSPSGIVRGFKDKQALSRAEGTGYPVTVSGSRTLELGVLNHGTAVLTDTSYSVYDAKGRKVVDEAHYLATPAMKTARRYTLLFDRSGTAYSLRTLSGVACRGETGNSIVAGALSESGVFGFVTCHESAHSYVVIYNRNGKVIHKWRSEKYHISDIAISPSGRTLAVCGFHTENGKMQSVVIVQKTGGDSNLYEYSFDDTLLFSLRFWDEKSAVVFGDGQMARVWCHTDKRLSYPYGGRELTNYDVSDEGRVALVFANPEGGNAGVVVLDRSLEEVSSFETGLQTPSVELTDSRVQLMALSRFCSYGLDGTLQKTADIPADSQSVVQSCGRTLIRGIKTVTALD